MREDQMNDASLSLVREIFLKAEFVRSLGIELTSCGRGWCETRIKGARLCGSNMDLFTPGC
jgi:hypothetical protein